MTTQFGFKEITPNNWLEPDEVLKGFVRISQVGDAQSISGNEYLRFILKPALVEAVPQDIKALFEVARGAMAYGYFFYPLFTLATEQLFRVAEAAVLQKCKDLGVPKSMKTFQQKIDWLVQEGVISKSESPRWHAARELRNSASHPNRQSILTPGNAIGMLEGIAKQVSSLYNGG